MVIPSEYFKPNTLESDRKQCKPSELSSTSTDFQERKPKLELSPRANWRQETQSRKQTLLTG